MILYYPINNNARSNNARVMDWVVLDISAVLGFGNMSLEALLNRNLPLYSYQVLQTRLCAHPTACIWHGGE